MQVQIQSQIGRAWEGLAADGIEDLLEQCIVVEESKSGGDVLEVCCIQNAGSVESVEGRHRGGKTYLGTD